MVRFFYIPVYGCCHFYRENKFFWLNEMKFWRALQSCPLKGSLFTFSVEICKSAFPPSTPFQAWAVQSFSCLSIRGQRAFSAVLVCISAGTHEAVHLFVCLLTNSIFSSLSYLFISFSYFSVICLKNYWFV